MASPTIVEQLSHFRILGRIGAGGMGEVYRARDEKLDRDVAVKVLPASTSEDQVMRARLLREARAAAALNHPHICTVFEVGEAGSQTYIAMECVDGVPLNEVLREGPLPPADVIRYGGQLAAALEHAHARGVIHRDLKPGNVIVTPGHGVKVLDFGLAKRAAELLSTEQSTFLRLTTPGAVLGTPAYMAPEQLQGLGGDARTDIWALGVMLYEMAVGKRPFRGQTWPELSVEILTTAPDPLPATVPSGLQAVIARCLAKEPGARFQAGGEVRVALDGIATEVNSALNPIVRRRHLLGGMAAALVVAVVFALYVAVGARRREAAVPAATATGSVAVLPFKDLSQDRKQQWFSDGVTDGLIAELSRIRSMKVISRTSVGRYRESDAALTQIARELGVRNVVEGSALLVGNRARVTARLVDAETESTLWTESYERPLDDIMSVHREVTEAIARAVRVALQPAEQQRLSRAGSVNPEAYRLLLMGRHHVNSNSGPEALGPALEWFEAAARIDPQSALAHAEVARTYGLMGNLGLMDQREAQTRARDAALRALEIDPESPEAHRGMVFWHFTWNHDWPLAKRELDRALELNPNDPESRAYLAEWLSLMGQHDEAVREAERARELAPRDAFYGHVTGRMLILARRFADAERSLRQAIAIDASDRFSRLFLGEAVYLQGRVEEAFLHFIAGSAWPDDVRERMREAARSEGAAAYWREDLGLVEEGLYGATTSAKSFARMWRHVLLGETDPAFEQLEIQYRERGPALFMLHHPILDPIRSDPRFLDLLHRLNLSQSAAAPGQRLDAGDDRGRLSTYTRTYS